MQKISLTKKDCNNLYLNIDSDILTYEKEFFKNYKDEISKICNQNVKWGIYKKNIEIDNKIAFLVDEYLDNLIFDNKELLVELSVFAKKPHKQIFGICKFLYTMTCTFNFCVLNISF